MQGGGGGEEGLGAAAACRLEFRAQCPSYIVTFCRLKLKLPLAGLNGNTLAKVDHDQLVSQYPTDTSFVDARPGGGECTNYGKQVSFIEGRLLI